MIAIGGFKVMSEGCSVLDAIKRLCCTFFWWCSLGIPSRDFQDEITMSGIYWLYLIMVLLKALFLQTQGENLRSSIEG
jgi:hypothetical protein